MKQILRLYFRSSLIPNNQLKVTILNIYEGRLGKVYSQVRRRVIESSWDGRSDRFNICTQLYCY